MEYSKDIVLGVKFFNGEDKHENLKLITEQPIKDLAGNDRVVIFQKEG